MHIWCYNIKNNCMKHSKQWGVHSFQIDGQAFTSSYREDGGMNLHSCLRKHNKIIIQISLYPGHMTISSSPV